MGREHKNIWGVDGGLEAQRADLWRLDLGMAAAGINAAKNQQARDDESNGSTREILRAAPLLTGTWFYARSVSFPEIKLGAEQYRNGSTPSFYPAWDEAPGQFQVVFIHDAAAGERNWSKIVTLLSGWLAEVRAGRNGGSPLGKNFKAAYAFDMTARLFVGSSGDDAEPRAEFQRSFETTALDSELEMAGGYTFSQAWLSGYKVGDLVYDGTSQVLPVTAQFYCRKINPV